MASASRPAPVAHISWAPSARTVRQAHDPAPAGRVGLLQVLITGSGGQVRGGSVGASGVAQVRADADQRCHAAFTPAQAPLQISDVSIPGVPSRCTRRRRRSGCRAGSARCPGQREAGAHPADRHVRRPARVHARCGSPPAPVSCGRQQPVVEPTSDLWASRTWWWTDRRPARPCCGQAPRRSPGPGRGLDLVPRRPPGSRRRRSYLVVNENFNAGWQATFGGRGCGRCGWTAGSRPGCCPRAATAWSP